MHPIANDPPHWDQGKPSELLAVSEYPHQTSTHWVTCKRYVPPAGFEPAHMV